MLLKRHISFFFKWIQLCCLNRLHKNAYDRISSVTITAIWRFAFLTFKLWLKFETVLQYICPQGPNTYGMSPNWQSHGLLVLQLLWRMPACLLSCLPETSKNNKHYVPHHDIWQFLKISLRIKWINMNYMMMTGQ